MTTHANANAAPGQRVIDFCQKAHEARLGAEPGRSAAPAHLQTGCLAFWRWGEERPQQALRFAHMLAERASATPAESMAIGCAFWGAYRAAHGPEGESFFAVMLSMDESAFPGSGSRRFESFECVQVGSAPREWSAYGLGKPKPALREALDGGFGKALTQRWRSIRQEETSMRAPWEASSLDSKVCESLLLAPAIGPGEEHWTWRGVDPMPRTFRRAAQIVEECMLADSLERSVPAAPSQGRPLRM